MNIHYQASRHTAIQSRQWPHLDHRAIYERCVRALRAGDAWLWPEPVQLELFGEAVDATRQ